MRSLFCLFLSIISFTTFAQSDEQLLNDKFRPIVFQLEKSLSSNLKERLSHPYPSEIISIQVKLATNPSNLLKRLGISLEKPKFALPGLDDSKEIANDKLLQFNPTLSDVVSVVTKMDVSILSSEDLTLTKRSDIQKIIESEVSTLGIKNLSFKFTQSVSTKNKETSNSSSEKAKKEQAQDYSLPIVIIISGLLIALVISIFLHQGMKRIETNLKELNAGLANLATSTGSNRTEPSSFNKEATSPLRNAQSSQSTEDINEKLQKTINLNLGKVSEYIQFIIDSQDSAKMLVLLEALNDEERSVRLSKLPRDFKIDFDAFISQLQVNPQADELLTTAAKDMIRDFKLLPHDEHYLAKKGIKHKISLLKKEDIAKVIENANESEFAYLLELIEPITLASTLALNPNLLSKYSKISADKLDLTQLIKLSEKLNAFITKTKTKNHLDLSLFLTPEVEAEFNKKSGKTQNSWESFSEPELIELERFARSLNVTELSSFIAILPEKLKKHVLSKLPDIKAQQIQRVGIKLTDQSFKLKHEFFAKTSKGAVQ